MQRVMIIGCAGSGKSTLARDLSQKTGLPVVHIDQIYWTSGWIMRALEEVRELVASATEAPDWIFEGNNTANFDLRMAKADTLIFIDLPVWLCLFRVLKRTLTSHGRVREDMAPGCPEKFSWSFLKWVHSYPKRGRPKTLDLLASAPASLTIHRLRTSRSVKAFLEAV